MTNLYAAIQCEQALIEAIKSKAEFTTIYVHSDGSLNACIVGCWTLF
jgi:hypothetical protein